MKILCIDGTGCALDWCMRCNLVGHEVKWFVREEKRPLKHGRGVVDRVQDWQKWMRWADLVFVTDNCQYMTQLQPYHNLGYPIFGSNVASAQFELDRFAGQKIFAKYGVKSIPSKLFHNYRDAAQYVKTSGKRLVCKPNGEADKSLSYVSPKENSAEALLYMLSRWDKSSKLRTSARDNGFILQDFVPGIEMGISGHFGPHGWNSVFTEHWEFKKLMAGDMGPNTGEMGTVIRYVKKSKLADMVLKPLTPYLREIAYRGDFAINCMVGDEGGYPWPLEPTCRAGWPSWIIETSLRCGDPAQWMLDMLRGRDTLKVLPDIAVGLVVAQGGFPNPRQLAEDVEGVPVYRFGDWRRHHPVEMMYDARRALWETCGDYVCVMTGLGGTVSGARRSAQAAFKSITIPNSPFYRDDVGERLRDQLPRLQAHGFALGMAY